MPDTDDNDDRRSLISGLLLEAGRAMEDASFQFALALPTHADAVLARIQLLEQTASDVQALAAAARALHRQSAC